MAKKKNDILESSDKANLTPMIDIVFLLLAYFMVTTAIQKEEGDLGMQLPVDSEPTEPSEPPLEAIISILPDSTIQMNMQPMDHYNSREMPQLTEALVRMKQNAEASGIETIVTIQADDESQHQRSVDAMNACAKAGIRMVTFGQGGG